MDERLNVTLTIDEVRTLISALDFHHNGLLDEYNLWDRPIDSAPQKIQDVLPRILTLADRLDDLVGGKE
jgi:hypothetical protein